MNISIRYIDTYLVLHLNKVLIERLSLIKLYTNSDIIAKQIDSLYKLTIDLSRRRLLWTFPIKQV